MFMTNSNKNIFLFFFLNIVKIFEKNMDGPLNYDIVKEFFFRFSAKFDFEMKTHQDNDAKHYRRICSKGMSYLAMNWVSIYIN